MRRLLKKEVSLDTYTWQKKYGHLTSSIMMAAVDERLKRRFSVSASMEEISKIPAKGNLGSQVLFVDCCLNWRFLFGIYTLEIISIIKNKI
jgi:hypothetical protein